MGYPWDDDHDNGQQGYDVPYQVVFAPGRLDILSPSFDSDREYNKCYDDYDKANCESVMWCHEVSIA